jgi:hypothetical protein
MQRAVRVACHAGMAARSCGSRGCQPSKSSYSWLVHLQRREGRNDDVEGVDQKAWLLNFGYPFKSTNSRDDDLIAHERTGH